MVTLVASQLALGDNGFQWVTITGSQWKAMLVVIGVSLGSDLTTGLRHRSEGQSSFD